MDIADLYPNLSSEELKAAEENLKRYFEVAWEIAKQNSDAIPLGLQEDGPKDIS